MDNKYPKCPRCRTQNVELIEIWDAYIVWTPEESYANDGLLLPGDPHKVEGHCLECNHRWRIRRVIQVQKEWFTEKESEE